MVHRPSTFSTPIGHPSSQLPSATEILVRGIDAEGHPNLPQGTTCLSARMSRAETSAHASSSAPYRTSNIASIFGLSQCIICSYETIRPTAQHSSSRPIPLPLGEAGAWLTHTGFLGDRLSFIITTVVPSDPPVLRLLAIRYTNGR